MNKLKVFLAFVFVLGGVVVTSQVQASDHDDGESDLKGRALNLTDVYAFREDKEVVGGSNQHLIFIINSNPRSLPQQQYFFSSRARYELHISRAGTSKDVASTSSDNVVLRLEFAAPDASNKQAITVTSVIDGTAQSFATKDGGGAIYSTPFSAAAMPVNSDVTINSQVLKIFAGLRRDPFFFDVTSFFKFRAKAASTNGAVPVSGFAAFPTYTPNGETASDFAANYNVNTIAIRVPIALLRTAASETVFDTWATISVPQ